MPNPATLAAAAPRLRRRLTRRLHRRQPHTLQIRHQLLGDLSAQLAADLALLRGRQDGTSQLGGERRFGRDIGGVAREIMDDDAIRPGQLRALVSLPLGHLGRRATRHGYDGEQQCCGAGG